MLILVINVHNHKVECFQHVRGSGPFNLGTSAVLVNISDCQITKLMDSIHALTTISSG